MDQLNTYRTIINDWFKVSTVDGESIIVVAYQWNTSDRIQSATLPTWNLIAAQVLETGEV